MFNLKHKISKRIHPYPNIKYDIKRSIKGFRKKKTAEKYGTSIDCNGISHLHNYLSLICNLKCEYCINKQIVDKYPKFEKHSPDEFVNYLNRLYNLKELYFNGGEHFIIDGFADVINKLDGFNILIFSNLPKQGMDNIKKLKQNTNNIFLDISYHPLQDDPVNVFVERLREIPKEINWNIHIIKDPKISSTLYLDAFRRYGIYGVSLECIYNPDMKLEKTKTVLCDTKEHILGPDMKIHKCLMKLLYGHEGISVENYKFDSFKIECDLYPRCKIDCSYQEIEYCD
jgi:hypothetical protein